MSDHRDDIREPLAGAKDERWVPPASPRPAKFTTRRDPRPHDRPMHPTRVTECWCGWSTTLRDSTTMSGRTYALRIVKLEHRLDHLEGRAGV